MNLTWRRINGMWTVYGPKDAVTPGQWVEVSKREGGTSRVLIGKTQPARTLDGRKFVYGYPQKPGGRSGGGSRLSARRNVRQITGRVR